MISPSTSGRKRFQAAAKPAVALKWSAPKPLKEHLMKRESSITLGLLAALLLSVNLWAPAVAAAQEQRTRSGGAPDTSNAALVRQLPGFRNAVAHVNGISLHYVEGGQGDALILLPGWPETWWEYHKVMPALANHFHLYVVDIRGMGTSSKPADGYDKKTMAKDIYALVSSLGYKKVDIAGHDIGSMVAFAYAANYPDATRRVALLDVPHPDDGWMKRPMLPEVGKFGSKIDADHPGYPWWFAFHQVKGLPEKLLVGRMDIYLNFLFDYLTKDSSSISAFDRQVYSAAYGSPDAIRAGDAWYQNFSQDVLDLKQYPILKMPVLGLGSVGYEWFKMALPPVASNAHVVAVENSGHFFIEEQPEVTARQLLAFFGAPTPSTSQSRLPKLPSLVKVDSQTIVVSRPCPAPYPNFAAGQCRS
jgi:pimeloyl-ACP methyl ester carboxylesterase